MTANIDWGFYLTYVELQPLIDGLHLSISYLCLSFASEVGPVYHGLIQETLQNTLFQAEDDDIYIYSIFISTYLNIFAEIKRYIYIYMSYYVFIHMHIISQFIDIDRPPPPRILPTPACRGAMICFPCEDSKGPNVCLKQAPRLRLTDLMNKLWFIN